MKIGLVIAVERELKAFLESKYEVSTIADNHRITYTTIINNNEIFAIKSGAGQIDAASATQYLITKYDVEIIMNFGVAGAIVKGLNVEDLFVVNKACNYDYDTSSVDPVGKYQYDDFEDMYIPVDKTLIGIAKSIKSDLKDAYVASGDRFIAYEQEKDDLSNETLCNICDMEIAAIARTCYLNSVKCLSLKCISDTYEGGAGEFAQNVERGADKAFKLIDAIIQVI